MDVPGETARQRRGGAAAICRSYEQHLSATKRILGEVGFGNHNHLRSVAGVHAQRGRSGGVDRANASSSRRPYLAVRSWHRGQRRSLPRPLVGELQRCFYPFGSAVALTRVRIACAVRPCRPMTRPRSPGAMNSSTIVCPSARAPSRGRPGIDWPAPAPRPRPTSRARLTTRPWFNRDRRRGFRHARDERPTESDGCARLHPVLDALPVQHERLWRGARVVVARALRRSGRHAPRASR